MKKGDGAAASKRDCKGQRPTEGKKRIYIEALETVAICGPQRGGETIH